MAGGRSTRMGRDKAALPWTHGDLLDHALRRLSAVTDDVRILSGPDDRYGARGRPVLRDAVTGTGGLAALVTALRALPADGTALLLAVDMPWATVDLLRHLAEPRPWEAVVPVSPRGAEPFCAAYAAACGPPVEAALAAGLLKMTAFWPQIRVLELDGAALAAFGDPARLFANLNTPEDYERARREAAREP